MSKKEKKEPIPSVFINTQEDAEVDFMRNIEILNKLLFAPDAKLRDAAKAINEMLTVVENILLSGFFSEYRKWLSSGKEESMPDKVVQWGEKIHKLIVSRGRLVMDMLHQIKEDESGEGEKSPPPAVELFQLPEELRNLGDEESDE